MSGEKEKIIVVGPLDSIGGLSTYINNLISSSLGKVYDFHCFSDKSYHKNKFLIALNQIKLLLNLTKEIRSLNPKFVLLHNNSVGLSFIFKYLQILVCKLCRVRAISRFGSGKTVDKYNNRNLHSYLLKSYINLNYKILVQTRYSRIFYEQFTSKNIVHILPNFVLGKDINSREMRNKKTLNVLFPLGYDYKSSHNKGAHIVLELLKKYPSLMNDFNFICILTDSKFFFEHDSLVDSDKILKVKPKSSQDIKDLYKSIDILLFLSKSEGFPNFIIELMVNGAAIISSKNGAMPEIVDHNKGGVVVESRKDYEEIQSILYQMVDFKLRNSFSKYNMNKVKTYYSEAAFVSNFKKILT